MRLVDIEVPAEFHPVPRSGCRDVRLNIESGPPSLGIVTRPTLCA